MDWDFWDGSGANANGWTTLNGTAGFQGGAGGGVGPGPGFAHDNQHVNFVFESPGFYFDDGSTVAGGNMLSFVTPASMIRLAFCSLMK